MITHPISGAGYVLEGIRLIARPGLRRFVIIPVLVNILVFSGAIYFGVTQFESLMAHLTAQVPAWLGWLEWLIWPVFILLLLVVVFYGFSLVANLIASPFNSLLAEKVERLLTGQPLNQGSDSARLLAELVPTLLDEIGKILYALLWAIPFLILLFVPVVGPVLWFLYTAWMLVVGYSDYPMGNHGLKFSEMRQRLRRRRVLSLGFGAATAGLGMVPVINFILMPAAVAGATAMWVREFRDATHYQGDHQSRVATRYVLLRIDHLSGQISGEILAGALPGQTLEQTATEDLLDLLRTCYRVDAESAEALEVYLTRERGHRIDTPAPRHQPEATPQPQTIPMDRNEACAILGISADASTDDISTAHRRLMQRLHPDRGGSDYLAARVNAAKRVLNQR